MIMTLVPLVGAAATHYSHFDMIHYGSYVSALSPLWMAMFTTGMVLKEGVLNAHLVEMHINRLSLCIKVALCNMGMC